MLVTCLLKVSFPGLSLVVSNSKQLWCLFCSHFLILYQKDIDNWTYAMHVLNSIRACLRRHTHARTVARLWFGHIACSCYGTMTWM